MTQEKPPTLLSTIVNLDPAQLHNMDETASYGTSSDFKENEVNPDVSAGGGYCGARRKRIKNAIFSKWRRPKTPRAADGPDGAATTGVSEGDGEEDIEGSYVVLDENTKPSPARSIQSVASSMASKLSRGKSNKSNTPNDTNGNTNTEGGTESFNNNPPQKLSTELFHWYINRSWKKKLLTLFVVASSAVVLYDLFLCSGEKSGEVIERFLDWMSENPVLGIYGYIGILAATSLVYIPPSPLIISSGFIFRSIYGPLSGPLVALLASYIGAVIGGTISYARANYMTRDLIRILMRRYPLLRAIDTAVVRNSLRVMFLLRMNPLIPFGVLNYLFGISGVSGASFVLGVAGVMPWHLWLIMVGASANSLLYGNGLGSVVLGCGMGCGVLALVITWKFAKKELQKEVNSQAINDFRIHDPNLAPQVTQRRSNNEVEEAGLEFGDYVRMQWFGADNSTGLEEDDYRSKLDWELMILDDFS